ncbi:hypothetical protein [Nakamurella sp.]|uniref:hypothetical protein n=1 Tax=Nakamurella sp. TaxID=1869182 RepID=UPI003784558F
MTARLRVTVAGPLSTAATSAVQARYDVVIGPRRAGDETVLDLEELDQSAIRGLLTLLWDFGHDVVAVTNETKERTS